MKRALFAGSFDPLTYGHLDIIERASKLTDELIIVVSASTKKTYLFTDQERLEMINNSLKDRGIVNCQAIVYDGLTVEVARNYDVDILIRAIRSVKDFEYERDIANLNAIQDEKIETLCFFSEPKYQHISSTMVKEIAYYGGNVGQLIPPYVEKNLKKAMKHGDV
ncbi:MAG: pantetheine-phosphate adenylyltransferase [Alkalibacterium gilvum]|uniref:pantetheine-phosphate adenylyltransferase n=1 Tax=Alkalibacterium TaxID=99906 RepID=UPI0026496D99|nr:pantetheine-phosphate adenylyltransferase [Alkalibacterium sp.]MDN6293044.1 pantetheine-phosphate adenylyltransferase [Alkalibacterium sp.]MDN6294850.1 pantetheine-phosphate adenylyltransferase [Alkalibacterium sp.]MDN6385920.1 pantetheine-phosphate adenylyltransferase [Alkalibacterium sp.]MDN6398710.1 pantetheine-phosphate adenylyltransferase [Alkalibacterium sp.]